MMTAFAVAINDWRVRTRSYTFFLVLGLSLQAGLWFVPDASANYATVDLSGYRGIYNSAWMGGMTSLLAVFVIVFVGFFIIRESPRREIGVGVWEVIGASPIRDVVFVVGKTLGRFAILNAFACAMFLAACVMQLVRHEDTSFAFNAYIVPYVLIVLPVCAITAAGASLFDQIVFLQGIGGGILWIVIGSIPLTVMTVASPGSHLLAFFDPLGMSAVLGSMTTGLAAAHPNLPRGKVSVGIIMAESHVRTFVFSGIHWSASIVVERIAWLAVAIGTMLLSTTLFDRYPQARSGPARSSRSALRVNRMLPDVSGLRLWRSEVFLLIGDAPGYWFVGSATLALGGLAASLSAPAATAAIVSLALIWPVSRYAVLGSIDAASGVEPLVLCAPDAADRVVTARIFAGAFVAAMPLIGILVHYPSLAVVPFALAACALASGSISRSPRLFETVFLVLWYGGANHVPVLDLAGDAIIAPSTTFFMSATITCVAATVAIAVQHARYRFA